MAVSPWMQRVNARTDRDQSTAERIRRQTISACYDVGNDFYTWMLGPSMALHLRHLAAPRCDAGRGAREQVSHHHRKGAHRAAAQRAGARLWLRQPEQLHPQDHRCPAACRGAVAAADSLGARALPAPRLRVSQLRPVMTGLYDRIVSVGMGEHVGDRTSTLSCVRSRTAQARRSLRLPHDELLRRRLDVQPGQALDLVRFGHHAQRRCLFDDRSHQGGAQDWRAAHRAHRDLWPALRTHRRVWLANCRRHREKIVAAYSDEFFRIYEYSWQMGAAAFETGMTLLHVVFEKQPYGADYREASSTLAPAAGEGHAGSTLFWPRRGHHQGGQVASAPPSPAG